MYLLGGAESSGTSKDAVMVYTPSILDEGLYLANVTIREGHFWSDIIQKPGVVHAYHHLHLGQNDVSACHYFKTYSADMPGCEKLA